MNPTDIGKNWRSIQRRYSTLASAIAVTASPSVLAVLIFIARAMLTHRFGFSFLLWNLFLAWVPLGCAAIADVMFRVHRAKLWQLLPVLAVWLIFLPNAPYILTDLVHVLRSHGMVFWYDLVMVLTFALAGLMAGVTSICIVQRIVVSFAGPRLGLIAGYAVVVASTMLCGVGMYLGRVLRWNSWDLLVRPDVILPKLARGISNPWDNRHALAFSILFGVLFTAIFFVTNRRRLPQPEQSGGDHPQSIR